VEVFLRVVGVNVVDHLASNAAGIWISFLHNLKGEFGDIVWDRLNVIVELLCPYVVEVNNYVFWVHLHYLRHIVPDSVSGLNRLEVLIYLLLSLALNPHFHIYVLSQAMREFLVHMWCGKLFFINIAVFDCATLINHFRLI
jgi:hypothetical protein